MANTSAPPSDYDEKKVELDVEPARPSSDLAYGRLDPLGKPLVPAATSDPLDPLNWSKTRKYTIVFIVCMFYFLLTYLTTAPIASFSLLEVQFNASYGVVNWTFAISAFGLALGPLATSALAETYGRRTIMIASTAVAMIASGCTSIKDQTIGGYMAARFFQGFGAGPAANVGLSIVNDISFEHERGFRIGLWAMSANIGSVFGGLIGGFEATVNQYWVAYITTILFGILFILEVFWLPETLYPRAQIVAWERHQIEGEESNSLKRTRQLAWLNFRKVPGVPHPKPWETLIIFCKMWTYPTLVASVLGYVFFQYWWIVNIATMIPAAYEDYQIQIQGLFFSGLLVGVIFSEIFCSGRLSDWVVIFLARKRGGQRLPEMRLWLGYPAAVLSTIGIIVWGVSVEKNWHWIIGQIALFLFAVGLQVGNTTLSAYIVDNYPEHAIEVVTFYSVIINMSAFIAPWFIFQWAERVGFGWCFGTQGIICTVCLIPTYVLLQVYGPRLRKPMILGGKGGNQVV